MARNKNRGIRQRTFDTAQAAKEKILEARDTTEDYLKKYPWASVAIAAGIGAAVAICVSALLNPRKKTFVDKLRDLY